jgi:hypothetical protein
MGGGGVAHDDVEPAEPLGHSHDRRLTLLGLGQVSADDLGAAAHRRDGLGGGGRLAALYQAEVTALPRQPQCDRSADPLAGAGDHGATALQRLATVHGATSQ